MTQGEVLDVMRESMIVVLKLAGPMLIVSLVVGLIVSIFQAATQINEQTLTFVPKLAIIGLLLLLLGPWMTGVLGDFMVELFSIMSNI